MSEKNFIAIALVVYWVGVTKNRKRSLTIFLNWCELSFKMTAF